MLMVFPNSAFVARNNKKGAITIVCEKHETVKTESANATSLFITLPAPDDPADSNKRRASQYVYKVKILAW